MALTDHVHGQHLQATVASRERLLDVGFEVFVWADLQRGAQQRQNVLEDAEPGAKKHGWQRGAAQKLEDCIVSGALWPRFLLASRTLFRSKVGQWLVCPSLACPRRAIPDLTRNFSGFSGCDASGSRFLLLTVTAGVACHSTLVATTEQLARQPGVLGRRGFALESAAARVCRKAGARVSLNVRVQDMDLARPDALDNRRLEIVADGLPLFLGAQLAVDATLVSVLRRDGTPRPQCANEDGAALAAARRRKEANQAGCVGLRGRGTVVRGSTSLRPQFGQRRATALEGPRSSSLAVEVGDLAGVQ